MKGIWTAQGPGWTQDGKPALVWERAFGCASGDLARCFDSAHATAEEPTTSPKTLRCVRGPGGFLPVVGGVGPPSGNLSVHHKAEAEEMRTALVRSGFRHCRPSASMIRRFPPIGSRLCALAAILMALMLSASAASAQEQHPITARYEENDSSPVLALDVL